MKGSQLIPELCKALDPLQYSSCSHPQRTNQQCWLSCSHWSWHQYPGSGWLGQNLGKAVSLDVRLICYAPLVLYVGFVPSIPRSV